MKRLISCILLLFRLLVKAQSQEQTTVVYLTDEYNTDDPYLKEGRQHVEAERLGQCQKELIDPYHRYSISSNEVGLPESPPFTEEERAWFRGLRRSYESRRFPVVRKEIRMLSDLELNRLNRAINQLNMEKVSDDSVYTKYTLFAIIHSEKFSPAATRNGPAGLGWHREYILLLEEALRQIEPELAMPYWDVSYDSELWKPEVSVVWDGKYFGDCEARGLDWKVKNGPYANWKVDEVLFTYATGIGEMNRSSILERNCAVEWDYLPFTWREIGLIIDEINFRSWFEQKGECFTKDHDQLHWFIGGMTHSYVTLVTVDPVTWFMHTFLDLVWEMFRTRQQTDKNTDYPVTPGADVHKASAQMAPFEKLNSDGISTVYTDQYYIYESGPRACASSEDCSKLGDYFCMNNRCQTKQKTGSKCFSSDDVCLSECITYNALKYCV